MSAKIHRLASDPDTYGTFMGLEPEIGEAEDCYTALTKLAEYIDQWPHDPESTKAVKATTLMVLEDLGQTLTDIKNRFYALHEAMKGKTA